MVPAVAADGEEALRVAGECRPDVALVDARMPGMDGVELMHRAGRGETVLAPPVADA
ncbi:response regulator [Nonomuraea sp. AD125B]|uniref:response regulator n=1 Tax=Nonomuraea sp. AD125B TaxID=3242897 RepID=UPI00352742D3